MTAAALPLVSVKPVTLVDNRGDLDLVVVTCSECGELTDWESPNRRPFLLRHAHEHAQIEHDGLVDREGWA